jgi:hypothetical protein
MRTGAGRRATKVKAEHVQRLDVRRWFSEGALRQGMCGQWVWPASDGSPEARIAFAMRENSLHLEYLLNGRETHQVVSILKSPYYGGGRTWFGCPRCGSRVAVLYVRPKGFACRTCNRIAYQSQSEDWITRLWRREEKLQHRLDRDLSRPKGMHRRTHADIRGEIVRLMLARHEAVDAEMGRRGWADL